MTTTIAFLLGGIFVAGRVRWLMNLFADRVHQQMIDGIERLRSRTPDGSTNAGPAHPQERPAGVETQAGTSPPTPVGTVSTLPPVDCAHRAPAPVGMYPISVTGPAACPPARSPQAPAGAGGAATRSAQLPAPAGPHSPRRLVHG